jgi:hypothetical protein
MTATLPSIGQVPMLVATLACMSFTIVYLAGFYVFVDIRTGGTGRSRNEPKVIVARCKAVIISSIITAFLVWLILRLYGAWPDSVSKSPHINKNNIGTMTTNTPQPCAVFGWVECPP